MSTQDELMVAMAKGAQATWRKSDKSVQAEVRNKMETARLHMCKKLYERQQSRTRFLIDKDKRQVSGAMRKMRDTSGYSLEAMPPDGTHDFDYQKTAYFQNKAAVREKQLQRWRATEREVVRTVYAEEEKVLRPPWETDPFDNITQSFNHMMRLLGYDVVDEDKLVLQGKESKSSSEQDLSKDTPALKPQQRPRSVPADIFGCLRGNDPSEMDNKTKVRRKGEDHDKKGFSVSAWEKRALQDYVNAVTRPTSSPAGGGAKATRRHHSSTSTSCDYATQSIRPHTAAGQRSDCIPTKALDGDRPKSAGILLRSTEKQTNNKMLRTTNRWRHHSSRRPIHNDHKSATSLRKLSAIAESDTSANTASLQNQQREPSPGQNKVNTLSNSEQGSQGGLSTKKSNTVNKKGGLVTGHSTAKQPSINISPSQQSDTEQTSVSRNDNVEQPVETTPAVSGPVVQESRPITHLSLGNENDNTVVQNEESTESPRRIRHQKMKNYPSVSDVVSESEVHSQEHTRVLPHKKLPKWKRDLLIEAPTSVFSNRTPLKVGLVMSKAQRKRELEQMVDENVRDLKGLVDREQGRRLQSRVGLYVTLHQMEQALEMEKDFAQLNALAATKNADTAK